MKGVILAGGTGSRLYPNTKVTNKHLLPVYDRPMIYYPVETLKRSGIRDILIVTGAEHAGDFMQLLGSGIDLGVRLTYKIQDGAGGIAQALGLAEDFAHGESIAAILSDNIFEDDFAESVKHFDSGAAIFVKEVENPRRFGVVELGKNGDILSIEEKPDVPKSSLAQTGFYIYDAEVFDVIRGLEPSHRGELEITDVNNIYLRKGKLSAQIVTGMWVDAGTHTSLLEASILAQEAFDPEHQKNRRHQTVKALHSVQKNATPKVTIGILTHNSEHYIEPCLSSLLAQDYDNCELVIFDNNSQDDTCKIIRKNFPDVRLLTSDENQGFSRSHNQILRETDGDFYACLNVDMIFEPNFISELVRCIDQKPVIASVGGKIKRWDFETYQERKDLSDMGKTNFIDSVGIRILKSHRFEDIGQGEVDYGQYNTEKEIFGVSGAAVLYRRKALEDIAYANEDGRKEYFDELMFMYKEDVDLAYRLQWAGWKSRFTPYAQAYHDRSVVAFGRRSIDIFRNRRKKKTTVNRFSYFNHQLVLRKNFSHDFSVGVRGATWWYNFKTLCYISAFEPKLLGQWFKVLKTRSEIANRRKAMPKRVSRVEIERFMES